jgi:hypothetical protein
MKTSKFTDAQIALAAASARSVANSSKDLRRSAAWRRLLETKRQRQRPHTTEHQRVEPGGRVGHESQLREVSEQRRNCDLSLEPGKRRADTKVEPIAERDVAVRVAPNVHSVWFVEVPGIALGSLLLPVLPAKVRHICAQAQGIRWRRA